MFLNINIFSLLMTTRKRHWVKTKVKLSFTDVYRVLRDFIKVNARQQQRGRPLVITPRL